MTDTETTYRAARDRPIHPKPAFRSGMTCEETIEYLAGEALHLRDLLADADERYGDIIAAYDYLVLCLTECVDTPYGPLLSEALTMFRNEQDRFNAWRHEVIR